MPRHEDIFFPARADRADWDFVLNEFPFPLALTYQRLLEGMERQEPVEAAWLLRDAFEAAMKFIAAVATADLLRSRPDPSEVQKVAGLLLKPTGLATGDWHSAVTLALEARAENRLLPELKELFYDGKGEATDLNLRLDGDETSFVAWRNREIGHGAFKQERAWYATETLRWLGFLHELYAALRPIFTQWTLVSETKGQEHVVWHGVRSEELRPLAPHEHEAWGEALPLFLVQGTKRLPLGPLLSIQQCRFCHHSIPFFFDKFKKGKADITKFGEYLYGQHAEQQDWEPTRELQKHLPEAYRFKATYWEIMAVRRLQDITFRDFDQEYLRPNYLIDAIHEQVHDQPKGYLHLIGPEGMGKTFLARGLGAESPPLGCAYLVYHILPGALADHQTFVSELKKAAEAKLPMGRVETQLNFGSHQGLQKEFADYLNGLKFQNKLKRLVLVIDGLDELADPSEKSAAITDLLPAACDLPNGVFVILTSRAALRPKIAADLLRLKDGPLNQPLFTTRLLRPEDAENQSLLRAYVEANLPAPFRDPASVETVLRMSGSVFLYAFHLCRAITSQAFPNLQSLPAPGQFYPAYLDRLRSQVGAAEFDSKYLRALLLLCAARIPVSLETLEGWGVPKGALNDILPDIKDFLHVHRGPRWRDTLTDEDDGEPRFQMAHEAFARFVQEDAALAHKLAEAHLAVLVSGLARAKRAGGWDKLDPETEATLYVLRFAPEHMENAVPGQEFALEEVVSLGTTAFLAGERALTTKHNLLALDLFRSREWILLYLAQYYPTLAHDPGIRDELLNNLISTLTYKGISLHNLTRYGEAIDCYDETMHILKELVELRPKLIDTLAATLVNKGASLRGLARYSEAVDCDTEAINLLRVLAETKPETKGDLAMALMNEGNSLRNLTRHSEAVDCHMEAIGIYRELVRAQPNLLHNLAMSLMNQGNTLVDLVRYGEAVNCYKEAIDCLKELVKTRPELKDTLAMTLMNESNALGGLARYVEAVDSCKEAVDLLRELVKTRIEVSNYLAGALVNNGIWLASLMQYEEAVACYEEAIAIYRVLVNARPELGNGLASALVNKGTCLQAKGQTIWQEGFEVKASSNFQAALDCFSEGIQVWERALREQDALFLFPKYIMGLCARFDLLAAFGRWEGAAGDVVAAFNAGLPYLGSDTPPPGVEAAFVQLLQSINRLEPVQRTALDDALGEEGAAFVRQYADMLG